jgi:ribosomal protein L40E
LSGLKHLGRFTKVAGWVAVILAVTFLFVIPFIEIGTPGFSFEIVNQWFMQTFFTVPSVIRILAVFIPLGLSIWSGEYMIQLSREREILREERVMGLLKAYGRISLVDLSNRLGLTVADTERYLASIRGSRDVVFSISDGTVIMPGFERSRPVKEIEKITREVVTVACRYCGALIPMGSTVCPECGASLKRLP